jgi:YidC/Oxa1 family membrane protein insertase
MEKRALFAFILSLAVLLLWEIYFQPSRETQAPQETQPPAVSPPSESPDTPPAPAKPKSTLTEPLKSLPPESLAQAPTIPMEKHYETWTVETPLYKAQVIGAGGRIYLFELKKYRRRVNPDSPPTELIATRTNGYLPLAMDFLHHPDWELSTRKFVSESPAHITLSEEQAPYTLTLHAEQPGQFRVARALKFHPNSYTIDVETRVQNLASQPLVDQLGISFYFEPLYGIEKESAYNPSQLAVFKNGSVDYFSLKEISKDNPIFTPPLSWLGYGNNYFFQAVIPLGDQKYQIVPRALDSIRGFMQVAYLTEPFQIGPNQEKNSSLRLYMGPKESAQLTKGGNNLSAALDYGWFGFLARPLMQFLNWLYKYTHNYGLAIIVLTILIKILFWPLTHKSYQSMQAMKKLQPKMAQIREKYKDDREKLNAELMMLYKTYKVNPLGGCLPMALQIPVFFALYRMLYNSVELLHKPFVLWINDLTAPDRLYVGFSIPYLGGLPVLTILMGLSMFIQQRMTPTTGDPRQEKIMLLMPVIFTVFFVNFPSGLVLYWLVNNILSIVQQTWINRHA